MRSNHLKVGGGARAVVLRRCGGACESCGLEWPWNLYLFIIDPAAGAAAANLRVLCSRCSESETGQFAALLPEQTLRQRLIEANNRRSGTERLTPARRLRLIEARGGCCEICGVSGSERQLQVHHRIAVLRGGDDSEANLLVLCFACHHHLQPCSMGCGHWTKKPGTVCRRCRTQQRLEELRSASDQAPLNAHLSPPTVGCRLPHMAGNWKQIIPIQHATDIRLITPFGLNVKIGDVISVGSDGTFTLEGSTWTQLNMDPGKPRPPTVSGDLMETSGNEVKVAFRAAGQASTLFPNLPSGSAGVDVHFQSADAWLLAIPRREIFSLPQVDLFRQPMLNAYRRGTWQKGWALVYEVVRADCMTLLAAITSNTDIALTVDAKLLPQAASSIKLTSGVSVTQTSSQITQWIQREPGVVGIRALRIQDGIWQSLTGAKVTTLDVDKSLVQKPYKEFWQGATDAQ